jgi:hypothetical protein
MEAEGLRSHGSAAGMRRPSAATEISSSVILICKVFLGNCYSSEDPDVGPVDVDADGERRGSRPAQVRWIPLMGHAVDLALSFWHMMGSFGRGWGGGDGVQLG